MQIHQESLIVAGCPYECYAKLSKKGHIRVYCKRTVTKCLPGTDLTYKIIAEILGLAKEQEQKGIPLTFLQKHLTYPRAEIKLAIHTAVQAGYLRKKGKQLIHADY